MEAITDLFNAATAAASSNNKLQNKKMWTPEFARFKLQFKFRNGETSIPYHSYDIHRVKGAKNVTDECTGLSKLILLIDKKRDQFIVATIWANLTNDLRTYVDGRLNMNYDEIVFKCVHGQKPWTNPGLKFHEGKLNVQLIRRITEGVHA